MNFLSILGWIVAVFILSLVSLLAIFILVVVIKEIAKYLRK